MHIQFKISKYLSAILLISLFACNNNQKKEMESNGSSADDEGKSNYIELVRNDKEKRVDVFIDGGLFTSYIYPETIEKPVLYPVKTSEGNLITRGFPLDPRPGERIDHPHHVGIWFNYGDVNGLDFWNNSYAIPEDKKQDYGSVIHREILRVSSGDDKGELEVEMDWMDSDGRVLLKEKTTFVFRGSDDTRIIDRITLLKALDEEVKMTDNKEGLFAIRVARELEHPSDKPEKLTDAKGNPTDIEVLDNDGVTGLYMSSEGVEGDAAWGTRARWMNLSGKIKDENISLAIMDHPDNIGYPAYWHARGYGLYAANSLGQKAMSGGKEELNFSLPAGDSVTFKYRLVVYSGDKVPSERIEQDHKDFISANDI